MHDLAIYLDLDEVLADYGHGMVENGFEVDPALKADLNRSGTSHPLKRQMYEAVKGTDFYYKLPLMPDALDLYAACAEADPIILTAAPKFGATEDDYFLNPHWLGAAYHKRRWVEEVLLPETELHRAAKRMDSETYAYFAHDVTVEGRIPIPDERFICTTSARKWEFMHRKHSDHQILIDDRIQNVEAWAAAGGIGILHLDAAGSIAALHECRNSMGLSHNWREVKDGLLFDPRTAWQ